MQNLEENIKETTQVNLSSSILDRLNKADREAWFCFTQNKYKLPYPYGGFEHRLAVGAKDICNGTIKDFETFLKNHLQEHIYGFFGYDLKNEIEPHLKSALPFTINWPHLYFFIPNEIIDFQDYTTKNSDQCSSELVQEIKKETLNSSFTLHPRMTFSEYEEKVRNIKRHIEDGDVYELNLCMEFFAEDVSLDPIRLYQTLAEKSPVPFSSLLKIEGDRYILCASPERFLKRIGQKLITQPMKGTIRRGNNENEDIHLRNKLLHDEKERAENMMIVDLSRNDLAKNSAPGSVTVEDLFGIYPFRFVHQMVSTITSEALPDRSFADIFRGTFPPGSMTGAPKIRSMELIEQYEQVRRGPFAGALGYFEPNGDFDLNVIIRTIFYHKSKKILNFQVGSAITYDSDPKKEYEECLLKAEVLRKVISKV